MGISSKIENFEISGYKDSEILSGFHEVGINEIFSFDSNFKVFRSDESLIVLLKIGKKTKIFLVYGKLKDFYEGLIRSMVGRVYRTIDDHILKKRSIFHLLEYEYDIPPQNIDDIITNELNQMSTNIIRNLLDQFFTHSGKDVNKIDGESYAVNNYNYDGLRFTKEKNQIDLTPESLKKFSSTILDFHKLVKILSGKFSYNLVHQEKSASILRLEENNKIKSLIVFYKLKKSVFIFYQNIQRTDAKNDIINSIIESVFGNFIHDYDLGKEVLESDQIGLNDDQKQRLEIIKNELLTLLTLAD